MTVTSDTCYNINRGGCGGAAVVVPDLRAPTGRHFERRNRRRVLVGFLIIIIIISSPPSAVQPMVVLCAGAVRGRDRPDALTYTPTEVTERRTVVLTFSPWCSRLPFGQIPTECVHSRLECYVPLRVDIHRHHHIVSTR